MGIAVATMGVGTLVEGGLVGLGWTAAGFGSAAAFGTTLVVSAAEAASFTFLSRQLLESDPQNSVILEFLMNWGLFTAMKGITAGYEAFVGAEEAATVVGKGTALLLQFETATAATLGIEYAKRKADGKELTKAEARQIVLESAAMFVGMAIAARVSKPMLEGLKLSGRAFGARIREINLQRAQLRAAATALEKSGNVKKAPEVLSADAKLLDQEQSLITDVMRASNKAQTRTGGKLSQEEMAELVEIRGQNAAALEGNARSRVMLKLEPAGGNVYLAKKGELNRSGGIADEYRSLGDEVTPGPTDPVTHSDSIRVKPSNESEPLRVMEKAGPAETPSATGGTAKTAGGCFVAGTVVMHHARTPPDRTVGGR